MTILRLIALTLLAVSMPLLAQAACINPAAEAGKIAYEADKQLVMFCNGTTWQPFPRGGGSFPVIRDIGTGANDTDAATMDIAYPPGLQAGDLLVMVVVADGVGFDIPGGWTYFLGDGESATTSEFFIAYTIATGAESGSVTLSTSFDPERGEGYIIAVDNYDADSPLDVDLEHYMFEQTGANTIEYPRSETEYPHALVLAVSMAARGDQNVDFPGGWTGLYNNDHAPGSAANTDSVSLHSAYHYQDTPGLTRPGQVTIPDSSTVTAVTIMINGDRGAPTYYANQDCATPGAVCPDGTVYAGLSPDGAVPMFTTAADAPGTFSYNNGTMASGVLIDGLSTCYTDLGPGGGEAICDQGEELTAVLDNTANSESPYAAAAYCAGLEAGGYDDWYLPSQGELAVLYDNRVAIGGFDTAQNYWSASPVHINGQASVQDFNSGDISRTDRGLAYKVRCVRKDKTGLCQNPARRAGSIIYNEDARVLQWCDGHRWHAAGPVNPPAGGGCTDPAGSGGAVFYNTDHGQVQYCNSSAWQGVGPLASSCAPQGLVGYWPMRGTAALNGIYVPDIVGGNAGEMENMNPETAWVTGAPSGEALAFDGVDDYVVVERNALIEMPSDAITIAAWVKWNNAGTGTFQKVIAKSFTSAVDPHQSFALSQGTDNSNEMRLELTLDGTLYSHATATVPTGTWVHVAGTWESGGMMRFYVNGVEQTTGGPFSGTITYYATDLNIGRSSNAQAGTYFDGEIADVRLYNRALTQAEIEGITTCNMPLDACETGPVGTVCGDGAVYAGTTVGGARMYVADADEAGSYAYGGNGVDLNGDNDTVAPELLGDGLENTNWLLTSGEGDHDAAQACRDRGADWYLPAINELGTLYSNRAQLGAANLPTSSSSYWSSSENDSGGARTQVFNFGSQGTYSKWSTALVRCVRR